MTFESLEAAIQRAGSPVKLLRNLPARSGHSSSYVVPAEHTNWRSEQAAWRESCALFDQSHHMTDLYIDGPGAMDLLRHLAVNSFEHFDIDRAKQLVAVNYDGQYLGDAILFHLAEQSFDLVGRTMALDWVQYNLETIGYEASTERDPNSMVRRDRPPRVYRYEIQGPSAKNLVEKLTGGPLPEIKFFHMGAFEIAGHHVRALRHGMAGQPGFEMFGPWEEGEAVLAAILEVGPEFGLVRAGSTAYATANLESGWIPAPVPAIFTGDRLKGYREWLGVGSVGSIGGSFYSEDIDDYYMTPFDLGYGRMVNFDHDFVGKDALQSLADQPSRTKVTLVWNSEDVSRVVGSLWTNGPLFKYLEIPKARYALYQSDQVLHNDEPVGISTDCGYIFNERAMVSLAVVDATASKPGTEVTVLWGEQPKSRKPQVEPHEQVAVRATVAPAPYVEFARNSYRSA